MKTFKRYLIENNLSILLEGKELHQFVNQHGDKILKTYGIEYDNSNIPKDQQTQHKTDFIEKSLGIHDMPVNHKRWVLGQVVKGNIPHLEDVRSTVRDNLQTFEKYQDAHKINLNRVNNPLELFNIAQKHNFDKTVSAHNFKLGKDYTVHGENEHWKVIEPHTTEASCAFGAGTNWCTASKSSNMFDHYSQEGPLLILHPKNPIYSNEKYQWHYGENIDGAKGVQFMNKHDKSVNNDRRLPDLSFENRPLPKFNHPAVPDADLKIKKYVTWNRDPNASEKSLLDIINDPRFKFTHRDVESGLSSPHESVALAVVKHPNFPAKTKNSRNWDKDHPLDIAMKSPHESVQLAAMKHPDFEGHSLDFAYDSPHESVKLAAIKHPAFDRSAISHLVTDPHESVALAAVKHPDFEGEHIGDALHSPHESVALAAVKHPEFKGHDLWDALNSPHESVARKATQHPKFAHWMDTVPYPSNQKESPHEFVRNIIDNW